MQKKKKVMSTSLYVELCQWTGELLGNNRLKQEVRQEVISFISAGISCHCYPKRKQVLVEGLISLTDSSPPAKVHTTTTKTKKQRTNKCSVVPVRAEALQAKNKAQRFV